eukprot:TRINITY_DN44158_c0_g1_i1.p1 TRINITY_DN44158_c0_g1~~TRINITY_DN44158_c0_g1_i1.p1  ORF type:complete len:362 (+),score=68.21 TRINITY_DN44158_c0_g1_i1:56-1141(+)
MSLRASPQPDEDDLDDRWADEAPVRSAKTAAKPADPDSLDDYWADDLPVVRPTVRRPRPAAAEAQDLSTGSSSPSTGAAAKRGREADAADLESLDDFWADRNSSSTTPVTLKRMRSDRSAHSNLTEWDTEVLGCEGGWAAPDSDEEKPAQSPTSAGDGDGDADDGEGRKWHINEQDFEDVIRWVECARVGKPIAGTRIVPCKTPFEGRLADAAYKEELLGDEERFTKKDLLDKCTDQATPIGLVIDLVNTYKYYGGFRKADGVEYHKLWIRGASVPPRYIVDQGFDLIDDFLARDSEKYVAVHCTHGVNRTGFFVCAYLMTRGIQQFAPEAMEMFKAARGEKIDKINLVRALHRLEVKGWY